MSFVCVYVSEPAIHQQSQAICDTTVDAAEEAAEHSTPAATDCINAVLTGSKGDLHLVMNLEHITETWHRYLAAGKLVHDLCDQSKACH